MASKAAGGLVLLGIGALLFASSAGASEKKPEPAPPGPGPGPLPSPKCVRTQPGDGPGNGKEAAVRAWQKCLIESGCLAPDGLDGKHDVITEGASKLYEANGGKCDAPYRPSKPGPVDASSKKITYRLFAQTAKDGKPKQTEIDSTVLTAPVKKADEQAVLQAFSMESDNWFGDHADEGPGVGTVLKNDGKKTTQLWTREYNQGISPGGSLGSGGSAGGIIA